MYTHTYTTLLSHTLKLLKHIVYSFLHNWLTLLGDLSPDPVSFHSILFSDFPFLLNHFPLVLFSLKSKKV